MNSRLLLLAVAAILLPSANYQLLDGVPLSTLPEVCVLTAILPALVSGHLRQRLFKYLRTKVVVRRALLGLIVGALIGKLVLLLSGTAIGLPGCYSTPAAAPPNGRCEASYENPRKRFGSTRLDRAIAFGPGSWNLSFLNSGRFNLYPELPGAYRRDRLPLSITWLGRLHSPADGIVEVTYTGEGRLGFGTVQLDLQPSYVKRTSVSASLPKGDHVVSIRYHFDDGSRVGSNRKGPYATLSVRFVDAEGRPASVVLSPARRPGSLLRAVALASDLAALAVVATIGAHALLAVRSALALAFLAAAAAAWMWGGTASPAAVQAVHWCFAGAVLLVLLWKRVPGLLALAFPLLALVSYARFALTMPGPAFVFYRPAGDDWLTYESFARTILETGSLEGGEAVFYYQPLSRYLSFAAHFLLGDGDLLPSTFFSALAVWAVLYSASAAADQIRGWRWSGISAAGLALLAVMVSPAVFGFFGLGASEGPTWVLLPAGLTLAFLGRSARAWIAGVALLALAAITRFNQLPVIVLFLGASLLAGRALRRPRAVALGLALFCALLLLPFGHNMYYGGRAVFTTSSATIHGNLVFPPGRALTLFSDQQAREALLRQLNFLASSGDLASKYLAGQGVILAFRVLQFAWVLATAWALWRRRLPPLLVLLIPAGYFLTHVFYQVDVYYPRHLIAGYLMVGWSLLYSVAWDRPAASARTSTREAEVAVTPAG